jgi:hypothetical protein
MFGTGRLLVDSSFAIGQTRIGIMARWRQTVELAMSERMLAQLTAISRSRGERASRVMRSQMLLAYRENPSFFAVGRRLGVHHQTVQRCVERAVAYGPLAALDDRPRPGKEPTITPEAKAWLVSLACDKAKEHGTWAPFRDKPGAFIPATCPSAQTARVPIVPAPDPPHPPERRRVCTFAANHAPASRQPKGLGARAVPHSGFSTAYSRLARWVAA